MFKLTTKTPGNTRHTYLKKDAKLMGYLRRKYKDIFHDDLELFVRTSKSGEKLILDDRVGRHTELQHWS